MPFFLMAKLKSAKEKRSSFSHGLALTGEFLYGRKK